MKSEQLWETTMNPENRTLYQVTIEQLKVMGKDFKKVKQGKAQKNFEFKAVAFMCFCKNA